MTGDYKAWILSNKDNIIRDIKRTIDIKSVKEPPQPGAPYGAGIRAVQLEAMEMCREAGLEVTDLDGHIAYAHFGDPDRFISVIAHLDVVPEGTGWDSDPYDMVVRDGYMVGRGTADDKGPLVLALWAIRYLIEHDVKLNYGIRLILGLDEECGMSDIEYYNEHCTAPLFTFTPDADFPVGHGEKGIYSADLVSPVLRNRVVRDMQGGVAGNVVPDTATAVVDGTAKDALTAAAQQCAGITVADKQNDVLVTAKGLAKHAGMPHGGVSAIHKLAGFLLDAGMLGKEEEQAVRFIQKASGDFSGTQFGIDRDDGLFTPVTIIAGMIRTEDDRFVLNVNSRYNTAITPEEMEAQIKKTADAAGFAVCNVTNSGHFYISPDSPAVGLLVDTYNEVTGNDEKPFVMSGGTYARHMENAVSFGIDRPAVKRPDWVGEVHMKNEAINIDEAMEACEIFIRVLVGLQDLAL